MGTAWVRRGTISLEIRRGRTNDMAVKNEPPILEMTIEGTFVENEGPPTFAERLMLWARGLLGLAIAAAVLLLVLWFLAFLLPAVALVVLLAYLAYRYQIWRDPAALTGGIGRVFRWNRRF